METYNGYVRTPADAIKLFEACRLGLLPRVQRRLSEKERQSIRSGSVFVWDEREAGMRRWTDGKSWSASRVSGSFLTYREMEGKRGSGFGTSRRTAARSPDSGRLSDDDQDGEPEGYRYKTDGLMKQSFSITTSQGQHLHLISYYARPLPGAPDLPQPTTDPSLRHITPAKGMYPESSLHDTNPPALTRTPMQPYTNSPGPQDHGTYGGFWAAPAWTAEPWPPSPRQTPPYSYVKHEPEMAHQAHPPPQSHRAPQLPPSAPVNHSPLYERLPPAAYQMTDPCPRFQQLQVQAAQAVMIDPRIATSVRNPQGPLPALAPSNRHPSPPRTNSLSPPQTSSSCSSNSASARKASLSSILLHPTPSSSEPNSANPANNNSGSSSPRALAAMAHEMSADVKALRSLDRKFCL
ncbi:Gti1/Pac2 family-domain-containing protein [Ustulina deusta]|nr:Gti1/Pac2 family-domain-containing protein [Ustulina deusta]KAI3339578.1 Gti1/Pac2 family-domain-containing protein [Ustulina deusta]